VAQRPQGGLEGMRRACSTSSALWPAHPKSSRIWELLGRAGAGTAQAEGMALAAIEP